MNDINQLLSKSTVNIDDIINEYKGLDELYVDIRKAIINDSIFQKLLSNSDFRTNYLTLTNYVLSSRLIHQSPSAISWSTVGSRIQQDEAEDKEAVTFARRLGQLDMPAE